MNTGKHLEKAKAEQRNDYESGSHQMKSQHIEPKTKCQTSDKDSGKRNT